MTFDKRKFCFINGNEFKFNAHLIRVFERVAWWQNVKLGPNKRIRAMCTMVLKTKKSENYSRKEHFLSLTFFYRNNYRILCELLSVRPKIFLEIKFFGLSCSLGVGPKAILKLCTKSNASYLALKNSELSISFLGLLRY